MVLLIIGWKLNASGYRPLPLEMCEVLIRYSRVILNFGCENTIVILFKSKESHHAEVFQPKYGIWDLLQSNFWGLILGESMKQV